MSHLIPSTSVSGPLAARANQPDAQKRLGDAFMELSLLIVDKLNIKLPGREKLGAEHQIPYGSELALSVINDFIKLPREAQATAHGMTMAGIDVTAALGILDRHNIATVTHSEFKSFFEKVIGGEFFRERRQNQSAPAASFSGLLTTAGNFLKNLLGGGKNDGNQPPRLGF